MRLLDYAAHSTALNRAERYAAVQRERIALRRTLLARDPEGYRATLPTKSRKDQPAPGEWSDADLAEADLWADPRNEAIECLASRSERRAFDRAVVLCVEVNLWLLPRLRKQAATQVTKVGIIDPETVDSLLFEGLEEAVATWQPAEGTLGTHAGYRCYARVRSYYRQQRRTTTIDAPGYVARRGAAEMQPSDPYLRDLILDRFEGLSDSEQRVLLAMVNRTKTIPEVAADLGLTHQQVKTRWAKIRKRFAPLRRYAA